MYTPHEWLKQTFEYDQFRPGQLEIIESIIGGHDTLALLPTGGGKSLCFQIAGLCLGGTTIVVSPLISLMTDQIQHLVAKGVEAITINSSIGREEKHTRLQAFAQGKYQFIYVSPETLMTRSFVEAALQAQVRLIVVDEAHCIAQWGNDFRPEYLQIAIFIAKLPQRPALAAFTATATMETRHLICQSLDFKKPQIFCQSFQRSNLELAMQLCPDRFTQELLLSRVLDKHRGQTGIIYTSSRESTEYLAQYLSRFHPSIAAYHAGLDAKTRLKIQDSFAKYQTKIIVATNAFGMGVDVSQIRFVIHYHLPSSLEAYYQEIGRAGRDGEPAHVYGLFFPRDFSIAAGFLPATDSPQYADKFAKLQQMVQFVMTKKCRFQFLLKYFGESTQGRCQSCDNCVPINWAPGFQEDQRYQHFLHIRDKLADQYQLRPQQLLTDNLVRLIALYQPSSLDQLSQIPGVGRGWLTQWEKVIEPHLSSQT